MTIPAQIFRRTLPTCERCSSPLRLYQSIQSGYCCCCRESHGESEWGCVVCGRLLTGRSDEISGTCLKCQLILNGGT